MPWSFRIALAFLAVFLIGVGLFVVALQTSGWDAIAWVGWGTLTAATGLIGGAVFSFVCAATRPEWRRAGMITGVVCVLLLLGLWLFWRAA